MTEQPTPQQPTAQQPTAQQPTSQQPSPEQPAPHQSMSHRSMSQQPLSPGAAGLGPESDLRTRAIARLQARTKLRQSVLLYVAFSVFFVLIWLFTGRGYFWPVWPILGWGFGVALQAYTTLRDDDHSEATIEREMRRLQG